MHSLSPLVISPRVNRGFKRVSDYGLPAQVIGLRNSLFQRDRPQLVQYMMMDSDVQDVFEEHQKNIEQQNVSVSYAAINQNPPDTQSLVRQVDTLIQGTAPHSTSVATSSTLSNSQLGDPLLIALRSAINHAQEFLNSSSTSTEGTATLRGIMQLLVVEGTRYLQQHQERQQPTVPAAIDPVPQQISQQSVQPQVVPDWNYVQQLMWFQFQQQVPQLQQPQQDQSQSQPPPMPPQLQPQVPVGPMAQAQQESQQSQAAGSFAVVPNWQLLHGLLQMQQQQQQQNQNEQNQNQRQDNNT